MLDTLYIELNNPCPTYTEFTIHELEKYLITVYFLKNGQPFDVNISANGSHEVKAAITIDDLIITDDCAFITPTSDDKGIEILLTSNDDFALFPGLMKVEFSIKENNTNPTNKTICPIYPLIIKVKGSILNNASAVPESEGSVPQLLRRLSQIEALLNNPLPDGAVTFMKLSDSVQKTINNHTSDISELENGKLNNASGSVSTSNLGSNIVTSGKLAPSAVTTAKIANNAVTYDKLSTELQNVIDVIPTTPVFVSNLGTLTSATAFDSSDYCTLGGVYQFVISTSLAVSVGITPDSPCELRYVNGYQVITVISTQQIFIRKVNSVAPTFNADSWVQIINPANIENRLTALENTVGTVDDILQSIVDGGVSNE